MPSPYHLKSLCVFGGSSAGHQAEYGQAARQLGQQLASRRICAVYGGGSVGMMGQLADAVLEQQGEIIGVIPEFLAIKELMHPRIKDMRIVPGMHKRKALMNELAEGFIAMPGGVGTFEELLEVMTWAQLSLHQKPIGLLNTNNFYTPLINFLKHTHQCGFISEKHLNLFVADESVNKLLELMESSVCIQQQDSMLTHAICHVLGNDQL